MSMVTTKPQDRQDKGGLACHNGGWSTCGGIWVAQSCADLSADSDKANCHVEARNWSLCFPAER